MYCLIGRVFVSLFFVFVLISEVYPGYIVIRGGEVFYKDATVPISRSLVPVNLPVPVQPGATSSFIRAGAPFVVSVGSLYVGYRLGEGLISKILESRGEAIADPSVPYGLAVRDILKAGCYRVGAGSYECYRSDCLSSMQVVLNEIKNSIVSGGRCCAYGGIGYCGSYSGVCYDCYPRDMYCQNGNDFCIFVCCPQDASNRRSPEPFIIPVDQPVGPPIVRDDSVPRDILLAPSEPFPDSYSLPDQIGYADEDQDIGYKPDGTPFRPSQEKPYESSDSSSDPTTGDNTSTGDVTNSTTDDTTSEQTFEDVNPIDYLEEVPEKLSLTAVLRNFVSNLPFLNLVIFQCSGGECMFQGNFLGKSWVMDFCQFEWLYKLIGLFIQAFSVYYAIMILTKGG